MANPYHVKRLKESTAIEWNKWRLENPDIIPDLSGADFSGYDFGGFNFRSSDFTKANLMNTNLEWCIFNEANLIGANLNGANLESAKFDRAHLDNKLFCINLNNSIFNKSQFIKGSSDSINMASFERSFDSKLETYRRDFEHKIEKISKLTPENQKELSALFEDKIDEKLNDDLVQKVGATVQEKSSDYLLRQKAIEYIGDGFNNASAKPSEYALKSEINARFFQWIGIGLAVTGVVIAILFTGTLSFIALFADTKPENYYQYLPIVLPSIFLCEVLAFIMFSMSSKALEKMQSFSKEHSTLDIKSAAMKSLILHGDEDQIVDASRYLTEMERNYILKKDEKTIEGEANQHNIAFIKEYAQAINPMSGVKYETQKKVDKPKAKV